MLNIRHNVSVFQVCVTDITKIFDEKINMHHFMAHLLYPAYLLITLLINAYSGS